MWFVLVVLNNFKEKKMKEITAKKEIIEVKGYVANDGTKFYTYGIGEEQAKKNCEEYEKTAQAVINTRVKKFKIAETNESDLTECGSDDYKVEIFKPITEADMKDLMMYLYNKAQHVITDKLRQEDKDHIDNVLKVGNEIISWWNYCDDWYTVDTYETWLKRILNNYDNAIKRYKE